MISNVTGFISDALGAFMQLWLMIHFPAAIRYPVERRKNARES